MYVINNDPKSTSNSIPSDSILFEHFALRTDFSINYYSAIKQNSFSLVPSAYALSCPDDGEGGTKEKIAAIDLIALTDYNGNYKTGDQLNDIIKIDGLPVLQFINNQNQYGLNQWGFDFTLTEKPDSTIKHTFNMVSTVFIMIMERTHMIGVLKAVGATNYQIRKIFFYITRCKSTATT